MIKVTNIQVARMIGALLILLSGDAFAVTYATQPALNTEISNRKSGDSTETARATKAEGALKAADTAEKARAKVAEGALKAADTAEVTNRNTAIAAEATRATGAEGTLTTAIATETARAKAAEPPVLIPGDSYQGGIVFWVDQTGQHGLIAAKADQSTRVPWYYCPLWGFLHYFQTHATADGIYAGAKNTEIIIATQTTVGLVCGDSTVPSYCTAGPGTATGDYAALIAANYSVQDNGIAPCTGAVSETCYGDWYLPSKVELNLLYNQNTVVGGFADSYYWSSTELFSLYAWYQDFTNGTQNYFDKNLSFRVRAVRAF